MPSREHVMLNGVNVVLPAGAFALLVFATPDTNSAFFAFLGLVVVLVGLGIVNLVAPFLLWRQDGQRALLPLAIFVLVAGLCAFGMRPAMTWRLRNTPVQPETFLAGDRKAALEAFALRLLAGGSPDSIPDTVRAFHFQRVVVDPAKGTVLLGHVYGRVWHEYLYAASELPPPYTSPVAIDAASAGDWSRLPELARALAPASAAADTVAGTESADTRDGLALDVLRAAVGDSLLSALAQESASAPVPDAAKRRVLAALDRACRLEARLLEDPRIAWNDTLTVLRVQGRPVVRAAWANALCARLVRDSALVRVPGAEGLRIAADPAPAQRNAIEWLQAGLLDEALGGLLDVQSPDHGRRLDAHWYYRRW